MGPAGLEPDLEQSLARAAARRPRNGSPQPAAGARRRRPVSGERWSRPSGASIVPVREDGQPSTSARYCASPTRVRRSSRSAPGGPRRSRATTSSPDVSRSSRWTMPGRPGSSPPPSRSPSASTRVGSGLPGARWTSRPAGLSMTARCSSLQTTSGRSVTSLTRIPRRFRPARCSRPAARELRLGAERVHPDEDHDAERDLDVGEVERRPRADVDEVGDRALADPVDQVPDRAAREQADRQPEAAAVRRGEEDAEQRPRRRPRRGRGRATPRRRGARRRCRGSRPGRDRRRRGSRSARRARCRRGRSPS